MRTYGRVPLPQSLDPDAPTYVWVQVDLDENGQPDLIWVTTLIQTLKLNYGESPFYANYGIPAKASLIQQIPPDFYVAQTQAQYAQYFANLMLARLPNTAPDVTPRYRMVVTTNQGFTVDRTVAE